MALELSPGQRRVYTLLEEYLRDREKDSDDVVAVEPDSTNRWMVRLKGRTKDFTTIWFTVGDRTLQYETYFMPDPEENHEELYRFLLLRNEGLYCSRFSLADDHDVFLTGQLPLEAITYEEIDRIVGSLYSYVETFFGHAIRIGYATHFASSGESTEQPEGLRRGL